MVRNYDDVERQIGVAVHQTKERFSVADEEFSKIKDLHGRSMSDVAKEYWDNPEKQRREIADLKRRYGR
jgi:hypothetical protein